jgi:hypothetical protein
LVAGCGGSRVGIPPSVVKQAYANELQPNQVASVHAGLDPDQEPESSADNTSALKSFPNDRYQLLVTNTSDTGSINEFSWAPPTGMEVTRVLGSSSGHCALVGRAVVCDGNLPPPKCSCQPGGTMTVDFTAHTTFSSTVAVTRRVGPSGRFAPAVIPAVHFGVVNGVVEIVSMTPVPYKIRSNLAGNQSQEDLPVCSHAQPDTHAHPCVPATNGG